EAAYYEDLAASFRRFVPGRRDPETLTTIEAQLKDIKNSVIHAVEQIDTAYEELSRQNLNPRTTLYSITRPFLVTTQRAVTLPIIGLYGLLTVMLSSLIVPLVCIIHYYFRREIISQREVVQSHKSGEDQTIEPKTRTASFNE